MKTTRTNWSILSIMSIIMFLVCTSMMMAACGDDDDSPNKELIDEETDGDDDEIPIVSKYKASDLYGVWTQTQSADVNGVEVYDDPNDQYGITFQSDGIHGRTWRLRNGGVRNSDFKWSFKNDWVHIIELNTGNEFDYEILLLDSKKTLIMDYRDGNYWTSDTYVKN